MNGLMNLTKLPPGFSWAHLQALYLLFPVGLITVWMLVQVDSWRKLFAPLMRAALLVLLVLALAGPERVATQEGETRPVLIDMSRSITPAMREWEQKLVKEDLHFRAADPVIAFGLRPSETTVGNLDKLRESPESCADCGLEGTDIEAALHKVAATVDSTGGPVVMITDGWENHGDARRAANALRGAGIQLYVFTPPGARNIPDVAMTDLSLPRALPSAEPFQLGVTMLNLNDTPVSGTIRVMEDNRLVDQREVTLSKNLQRFDFPVRTEGVGLVSYRAEFKPSNPEQDIYRENDSQQGWVGIGAKHKVLILSGKQKEAGYLQEIVKRLGLEPQVVNLGDGDFNGSLDDVNAVLLNNVPSSMISSSLQNRLTSYVDKGGAMAAIGGDQSFSLGNYQHSGIENLLPVISKPPEHKQQTRALVLIIDKSGSMGRQNKLLYAKAAARTATKALKPDDYLSVIGFDAQPFVVVPLQRLSESLPYLDGMIDRLKAGGTTYLMPALKEAERDLAESGAQIKHVVILTDGETGGTAAQYYDLISSMHRDGGVTISTIAIGPEPNLRLLSSISDYGGGAFYHTYSAETLPELFLQDVRQHSGDSTLVEKELIPVSSSPDAVLKELAGREFPPLKGYVGTQLKSGANLDLFVERHDRREPLIASWRYGTGKVLAVTTDASGRWSSEWIRNGIFNNVWDKLLTWLSPATPKVVQKFDVAMGYREGRIELKLTDYSDQAQHGSHLLNGTVKRPDGVSEDIMFSEDSPGELTASFDAPRPGTYRVQLKTTAAKEQQFPPLAYTVSPAVVAELPRTAPNYDLLEHLSSATGGRLNPDPGEVALARPKLEQKTSLASNLLIAAMLLLIAEALVRRLTT